MYTLGRNTALARAYVDHLWTTQGLIKWFSSDFELLFRLASSKLSCLGACPGWLKQSNCCYWWVIFHIQLSCNLYLNVLWRPLVSVWVGDWYLVRVALMSSIAQSLRASGPSAAPSRHRTRLVSNAIASRAVRFTSKLDQTHLKCAACRWSITPSKVPVPHYSLFIHRRFL